MIRVFIPTAGRVNKQMTWDGISEDVRKVARVTLVVPPDEVTLHQEHGRRAIPCPVQGRGIARVRDWILDYAYNHKEQKILQLDDDLRLYRRYADAKRFYRCNDEWEGALEWLDSTLDSVVHCSLGVRYLDFAAPLEKEFKENGKAIQALAFDVPKVIHSGARFCKDVEPWMFMTDVHMTLQLLKLGYSNRISHNWRFDHGPTNAAGGCSALRTSERMKLSGERLAALHPGIITTFYRPCPGLPEGQMNLKVRWKEAFNGRT